MYITHMYVCMYVCTVCTVCTVQHCASSIDIECLVPRYIHTCTYLYTSMYVYKCVYITEISISYLRSLGQLRQEQDMHICYGM